jgi:response regulator of citrate/malate metabolism
VTSISYSRATVLDYMIQLISRNMLNMEIPWKRYSNFHTKNAIDRVTSISYSRATVLDYMIQLISRNMLNMEIPWKHMILFYTLQSVFATQT